MMNGKRRRLMALLASGVFAAVGCGSCGARNKGLSSGCGTPYTVTVVGAETTSLGNCAGSPIYGEGRLHLSVGKDVTVRTVTNQDGSLAATPPSSSDSTVLKLTGRRGPTEVFRAEEVGTAELLVSGPLTCVGKPAAATACRIAQVHVLSR